MLEICLPCEALRLDLADKLLEKIRPEQKKLANACQMGVY